MLPNLQNLVPGHNVQLDSCDVHPAFGEVNLTLRENGLRVSLTVLMSPTGSAEGWQTGVAIDCSTSMKSSFGGKNTYFARNLTEEEKERYVRDGLMEIITKDGMEMCRLFDGAYEQMLRDGILYVNEEPNVVEETCRKILPMLAGQLDADGGTTVIYWAMGEKGDEIQVVGDLTEESASTVQLTGVSEEQWGSGTCLMPAINYFMETFKEAPMGLYIFITDGRLDDFAQVREYTIALSKAIHEKKVNPVKFVLIGIGPEIDKDSLAELDDLPDTCNLPVDIWDHKIAADMRSVLDVFSELVDENKVIAPSAELQDDEGRHIKSFTDGLTAKIEFMLPAGAHGFRMILPNGKTIEQQLLAPDGGTSH